MLQVYYILVLNAIRGRALQSILVNSNNLSFIEAILNVTSICDIKVYVVLADLNDSQLIMKTFPNVSALYSILSYILSSLHENIYVKNFVSCWTSSQLTKSQFLDRNDCKYEIQIKSITKGEGVDVVINSLTDMQNISSAANCLKMFGKFVDLTNKQYKDDQQFGTLYIKLSTLW